MNTIVVSESEYQQLQATIRQLTLQLTRLQAAAKPAAGSPRAASVAQRLHGVLAVPTDFDEKQILQDEILKKHLAHG